jgi:enamine deaminase RidA (YjgF/YER057c/UK114 family)
MKTVLAAAGLTMADLIEIVSYHTDMQDDHAVVGLGFPGQRLEIEAIARAM